MSKPPYRVPLVAETAQEPRNGLVVASTFSGGGGSCYGYELAGYTVAWANEMVQASRDTYRANHPHTVLDPHDIRLVQPQDVLDAAGLAPGELDLLDGSPPCQSFSMAGRRSGGWGKTIKHGDGTEQISDDLFFEFIRLLEGLQPRTFVAENVRGLVTGVAKGQFKRILAGLKAPGYRVGARLLDASWLGVPQARHRLIFVGVREDLGLAPVFPRPLPYQYTLRDALPELHSDDYISMQYGPKNPVRQSSADSPAPTAMASGLGGVRHGQFFLNTVEPETRLTGKQARIAAQLRPGQNGSEVTGGSWFSTHRDQWDAPASTVLAQDGGAACNNIHPDQTRRMSIAELRRICGFPDDYVLTGTYAEQWARLGNAVPPPMTAAVASVLRDEVLLPDTGGAVIKEFQ